VFANLAEADFACAEWPVIDSGEFGALSVRVGVQPGTALRGTSGSSGAVRTRAVSCRAGAHVSSSSSAQRDAQYDHARSDEAEAPEVREHDARAGRPFPSACRSRHWHAAFFVPCVAMSQEPTPSVAKPSRATSPLRIPPQYPARGAKSASTLHLTTLAPPRGVSATRSVSPSGRRSRAGSSGRTGAAAARGSSPSADRRT